MLMSSVDYFQRSCWACKGADIEAIAVDKAGGTSKSCWNYPHAVEATAVHDASSTAWPPGSGSICHVEVQLSYIDIG